MSQESVKFGELPPEVVAAFLDLDRQKDQAYEERDRLVALLSKIFPAWLERHPEEDKTWDNDWRWIVYVIIGRQQCSWHIHDSELSWFDHLHRLTTNSWDGHTTEEKYERIERFQLKDELFYQDCKEKA